MPFGKLYEYVYELELYENLVIQEIIYLKLKGEYYSWKPQDFKNVTELPSVDILNVLSGTDLVSDATVSYFLDLDIILNCKPLPYLIQEEGKEESKKLCCYFKIGDDLYFYNKSKPTKKYIVVKNNNNISFFRNIGIPFNGVFVINLEDLLTMGSDRKSDVLYFDNHGPYIFSRGTKIREIPGLEIISEGKEIEFEDILIVNELLSKKNLEIDIKKISKLIDESDKNTSLVSISTISPEKKNFYHLILYEIEEGKRKMVATYKLEREQLNTEVVSKDYMVATYKLEREQLNTEVVSKDYVEITVKTKDSSEGNGYSSLLLNVLIFLIGTPETIKSFPIVPQTFASTLKYENIEIIISLLDLEVDDYEKYLEKIFLKKEEDFTDHFLKDETINKLKEAYQKYLNKNQLDKEDKKYLELFFEMNEDSQIISIKQSVDIYIPTTKNKDFAFKEIKRFISSSP